MAHVTRPQDTGIAATERLLTVAIALGIAFITINVGGLGSATNYIRFAVFGLSGTAITLVFIAGSKRQRTNADLLAVFIATYFIAAGVQDVTQSNTTGATLNLFGVLLALGATQADLQRVLAGLRFWFLLLIIATLVPAGLRQGFNPGREWFGLFPGRYFSFSNPDGLGFIAGLGVLLSIPALKHAHGRALGALSALLFVITAAYTAAIALSLAGAAYFLLIRLRVAPILQFFTSLLAAITVGSLLWISSSSAIGALEYLEQHFDLSGRDQIWIALLQQSRVTGHFWTGWGDQVVSDYTRAIAGVGSAHATILQMFLSKGFAMTTFFILVAALATVRILGRISSNPSSHQRLAMAVTVYWFVTSLASTQPGTVMGLALVVIVAIPPSETESKEKLLSKSNQSSDVL